MHNIELLCTSVHYYPRKKWKISFRLPYIVSSRINKDLIDNLCKDSYPVLLEGIQCTWPLWKGALENRSVSIRLHNIEHLYYLKLAQHERNFFKYIFFKREAFLLKQYTQQLLKLNCSWLTVSMKDSRWLANKLQHTKQEAFVPVFVPYHDVKSLLGTGNYCLYHGNLSVNENERAAIWLLEEIFSKTPIPFIIAGLNPSKRLITAVSNVSHAKVIANPTMEEMDTLISEAHINILPSLNETGVKLKVLHALYMGRYCITNNAGSEGSGLTDLCIIANEPNQMKQHIITLMDTEFTNEMKDFREKTLHALYNNNKSAEILISYLFPHDPKPGLLQSL
ncbi:MAG: glycosyltransferase family 4 protein [Ferruginibacter sp.]|nr:glycosyltransferase family 4 protein [Ferruginibacter sp.]